MVLQQNVDPDKLVSADNWDPEQQVVLQFLQVGRYEGAIDSDGATEFFGVTESSRHVANECRIAFWADSSREVDRLAEIIVRAEARNVEGPGYHEGPGYYAVFLEDPSGNQLEIGHRTEGSP